METPQQLAFDSRREEFAQQVLLLRKYLQRLKGIRESDVFLHAAETEQLLLERALGAFGPVLERAAECTEALLVFVAGMICFGCDPNWDKYVWRDNSGAVMAVNVAGESCVYVDQRCGSFGRALEHLGARLMESSLAKMPATALPDLGMLADRESTCAWLRHTLALHPLPGFVPTSPGSGQDDRRLESLARSGTSAQGNGTGQATGASSGRAGSAVQPPPPEFLPTAPPYATRPTQALDAIRAGLDSGFHLHEEAPASFVPGTMYG